jgi:hypothetical protein
MIERETDPKAGEDVREAVRAKKGAPNVIFFILDDVGYGQMSAFGGLVNTSNLDRLVQNKMVCATPICTPQPCARQPVLVFSPGATTIPAE